MSHTPAWFDEEPEAARPPRRRFVSVAAIAAASWVVLALVLVRGGGGSPVTVDPEGAAATAGVRADTRDDGRDDQAETDRPDERGMPAAAADPGQTDGGAAPGAGEGPDGAGSGPSDVEPTAVGREEAEALAIAVVRGWLSDGGPDLPVPGIEVDRRAYLEHVAVESVVVPSDGLAVARTLLVLLVRDGDHYTEAIVRRAAVPLTVTPDSVHPGGPPWWLPSAPDLTPVAPEVTASAAPDAGDSVAATLEAAGYAEVRVAAVRATDGGTLIADVTARTPTGDPVQGPVWLHPTPQGLVVLGDVPQRRAPSGAADGRADP